MKFSANLGFLWTDLPLPDAIRAAGAAGFDAVECHWPFDVPSQDVNEALRQAGIPMLGLNTRRGDVSVGENGLSALPGRDDEARAAIDEALHYANEVAARHVHVMAGVAQGEEARRVFVENLRYACTQAKHAGLNIVIEPLNAENAPGYFLSTTDQAVAVIKAVSADNLFLMFDCYHVARTEGAVLERLQALWPYIGHIQFAGVPDRGRPDRGSVNYSEVFRQIDALGYVAPLGAEYRPDGAAEDSLDWMASYR